MGAFGKIDFNLGDGGLGATPTSDDSISGLIVPYGTTAPTSNSGLRDSQNSITLVTSFDDAVNNSWVQGSDFSDSILWTIKSFYSFAPSGTLLYIMGIRVANGGTAPTFATLFPPTAATNPTGTVDADLLIELSNNNIRQLGVFYGEGTGSTLGVINLKSVSSTVLLPGNVDKAPAIINVWAERYAGLNPVNVILNAGMPNDDTSIQLDKFISDSNFQTANNRYVSMLLGVSQGSNNIINSGLIDDGDSGEWIDNSLGNLLGKISATPVQENIAWVDAGALRDFSYTTMSDNREVQSNFNYTQADITSLANTNPKLVDKGFIGYRKYAGLTGTYFTNGLTLASSTSDYQPLANVRVINKVTRLLREVYLPFIHGDVQLDLSLIHI